MEYIKEDQILLYEELCSKDFDRDDRINRATVRFRENIKLAHYVLKNFSTPIDVAVSEEDLMQEAYLGLWKACIGFDESKGFEFSTYAVITIKGYIMRMLRDMEAINTPRSFKDIRSAIRTHGFKLPLSEEEIDILESEGVASRETILSYFEVDLVSLDYTLPGKDKEGSTLGDIVPDLSMKDFSKELSEEEIEKAIEEVLDCINSIHRDLVEEWLYSMMEGEKVNQHTLAKKYNISQCQVSRILRNSINSFNANKDKIREIFGY